MKGRSIMFQKLLTLIIRKYFSKLVNIKQLNDINFLIDVKYRFVPQSHRMYNKLSNFTLDFFHI